MKVYGITGWKNSGKTGLMERLVAEFTARGLKVSTIKHAHHNFDVDHPGKDSFRHRQAGAHEVVLASSNRVALMHELRGEKEPSLDTLLARIGPADLVLIEGYKRDRHPKIEAHRAETGQPLIAPDDPTIRAIASDSTPTVDRPLMDLNDTIAIADFILADLAAKPNDDRPMRNDCFALPPGVHWTPVDEALAMLRERLSFCVGGETVPLIKAEGRIAAADMIAARANPPLPNTAVDGYGFAGARGSGSHSLELSRARAAAGDAPVEVLQGQAIRILTGAALPDGVDTVVLQEECTVKDGHVHFEGPIKAGANTRKAGEDVNVGDTIIAKGRRLTSADLALLSATGCHEVPVFRPLRVGVLSTGDELIEPGMPAQPGQIHDANRPMLLSLIARFGHEPVDLGRAPDDREALRGRFDSAMGSVDAILTSGGASAGDEDHVSALLSEAGAMALWRIAIKPGRPLALGMWQGLPVFGLPGNPVAAMVCTLIFARPALGVLAGANWQEPQGFDLPAAFSKRKKAGRREFLRARIRNGRAEVFASEGSGRISGLSWAEGLVELPDHGMEITPGDLVRYIPFSSFGI